MERDNSYNYSRRHDPYYPPRSDYRDPPTPTTPQPDPAMAEKIKRWQLKEEQLSKALADSAKYAAENAVLTKDVIRAEKERDEAKLKCAAAEAELKELNKKNSTLEIAIIRLEYEAGRKRTSPQQRAPAARMVRPRQTPILTYPDDDVDSEDESEEPEDNDEQLTLPPPRKHRLAPVPATPTTPRRTSTAGAEFANAVAEVRAKYGCASGKPIAKAKKTNIIKALLRDNDPAVTRAKLEELNDETLVKRLAEQMLRNH